MGQGWKIRLGHGVGHALWNTLLTLQRISHYSPVPMRKAALLLALLLAACSEKQADVKMSETLPNIPVPPNAQVVSREGGDDALKLRFRTSLKPEQVANYYRQVLSKEPFTLISDTRTADQGYALYAEQTDRPSLWVKIAETEDKNGSLVDLAGAKNKPPRP